MNVPIKSTQTGAAGSLEYLDSILPEAYRENLRKLLIFTLKNQIARVACDKQDLEDLGQLTEMDALKGTW